MKKIIKYLKRIWIRLIGGELPPNDDEKIGGEIPSTDDEK
jgi:hypothetical protein